MADDLTRLSAGEAARRFRDRSLSPVQLLDAIIDWAEAAFGGNGDAVGPLTGIPLAVKDTSAIMGKRFHADV